MASVHDFPNMRSIPQLISDVLNHMSTLVQKEFKLARVEMSENASRLAAGIGLIVVGAVLLIPALVILLNAAVAALESTGLAPYWSALAIGGGVFLIGMILMLVGRSRLKPEALMPKKTMEQLRQDASVAAEQVRTNDGTAKRAA